MTKKALVISDLHLRPGHFEVAQRILDKAEYELSRLECEYLIIGGDTFHTKNVVYASMLTLFEDFLKRVTKKSKVIIIIGNHDWGIPYSVHALQTLHMPNLVIVEETYKLNEKVGFIGYCREQSRFDSLIERLKGCEILFGHFDINGFELGSGWEESDCFCGPERFTEFKKVFSGHFHKAQEKTLSNGTEIVYVGTGYTTDFNETDQEKRFIVVDLETGEWSSVPTNLTLHKTLRIQATESLPPLNQDDLKNGVNFRVIISGSKEQIAAFIVPGGYQAKITYEYKNSDVARLDISATDNQDTMMKKYVDFEIKRLFGSEEKSQLDRDKIMRIGRSILSKVSGGVKS